MKRSSCPITCTLDLLGDKWTLIILRDAIFRNFTTYGEFQTSPEQISSNILAARLKKMVGDGIFERVKDADNKLKIHYKLTPKGASLKKVIIAVGTWGSEHIAGTLDAKTQMRIAGSTQ